MLLNTVLLILGSTRLIHSNALAVHPTPTPDLYAGLDQSVLTNAERLQLGLSPLKPRQLWKADRVQRRQAENSGSPSVSESGFLYAVQSDGTSTGCVISDGTWYVGGTCATYKQVLSGDSATFSTSKGPCEITSSGTFSCASGNTATIFVMGDDGTLSFSGSTLFSADQVPSSNVRQAIYTGDAHATPISLQFKLKESTTSASSSASSTGSPSSTSSAVYPTGTGLTVCSAYDPSTFGQSCSSSSVSDTCCTDSPGGHFLVTMFWDTGAQSTGPNNSWTLHGLWPDNCDGTYEQFCDASRESTDIRGVLQNNGQTDLLSYMNVYWKDYQGDDETFWEHEWNKHGTCISTLEPKCFNKYYPQEDIVIYFNRAVSLFKGLPAYDWLEQAGIVPSVTATYTFAQIQAALSAKFGGGININCDGNVFNELWYHYRTQGGVASGNFIESAAVGSGSTCPSTGIRFLPKYVDTTAPTPSSSSSSSGTAPTGGTAPGVGVRGFIYPTYSDGTVESATCLISDGSWYKGGSCAGYTLQADSTAGTYQLKTSKGLCAVSATTSALTCTSGITSDQAAVVSIDSKTNMISVSGQEGWSADAVPAGSTRQTVYLGSKHGVAFTLAFVGQ